MKVSALNEETVDTTNNDKVDEAVFLEHTASGGYSGVPTATLPLVVKDNDADIEFQITRALIVPEGSTVSFGVRLNKAPTDTVTLQTAFSRLGDFSRHPPELNFTTDNYATFQSMSVWITNNPDNSEAKIRKGKLDFSLSLNSFNRGISIGSTIFDLFEQDNDAGLIFKESGGVVSSLSVDEGGSKTYTVELAAKNEVSTTTVIEQRMAFGGEGGFTVEPQFLSFTQTNWSTGQNVTLSLAQDADAFDGTSSVEHVSGQTGVTDAYRGLIATLAVTEDDDETAGLTLSATGIDVREGAVGTYSVVLDTQPTASVAVAVARSSAGSPDTDLTVSGGATLNFTTSNWNTAQTVTLSAAADDDASNGTAAFVHTVTGGDYGSVTATLTATETDDDSPGLVFSPDPVFVPEGRFVLYGVSLATKPTGPVSVIAIRADSSDDSDLALTGGTSMTFTTTDWNVAQMVTLTASADTDSADGTAGFLHAALGSDYAAVSATLSATELDSGIERVVALPKILNMVEGRSAAYSVFLGSQPTAEVTVSVTLAAPHWTNATTDVTFDTNSGAGGNQSVLTFTTDNWSAAQTITVSALADNNDFDNRNEFAELVHTPVVTGGYGDAAAAVVSLNIEDMDGKLDLQLSRAGLVVSEGRSKVFGVRLKSPISSDATINFFVSTNSMSVEPRSLVFTPSYYNVAQSITITGIEDSEAAHVVGEFRVDGSGGVENTDVAFTISAEMRDNDAGLVIRKSDSVISRLSVSEGETETYTVALAARNAVSTDTEITVRMPTGGDANLSVQPAVLTFSQSNWKTGLKVTVSASQDNDAVDGLSTIEHVSGQTGATDAYTGVRSAISVMESDDEKLGLTLSTTAIKVSEGSSASYTVVLGTSPSDQVLVSVARSSSGLPDPDLTISAGSVLSFTQTDWNTAQTVMLTAAADDSDVANGTTEFVHTANGGGYVSVKATLTATELDDDAILTLSTSSLAVSEGGTGSYTVVLATRPTGAVEVAIANPVTGTHDADLTVSATTLTFTTDNWNTAQPVMVTAAADDSEVAAGTAVFVHTATGGGYDDVTNTLTASELDDDAILRLSTGSLEVLEGKTAIYTVVLATQPTAAVKVDLTKPGGITHDADLAVSTTELNFTASNWNTAQSVTVTATSDTDMIDGTAVFAHDVSGGGYDDAAATLTATELDNGIKRILVFPKTLYVQEGSSAAYTVVLGSAPSADVVVNLELKAFSQLQGITTFSIDTDPVTTGNQSVLTFTATNWNIPQNVKVSAGASNFSNEDEAADVVHTASATGGYGNAASTTLSLIAEDDDSAVELPFTRKGIFIAEGSSKIFPVRMARRPSSNANATVIISPNIASGMSGSPSTMTFTSSNYNVVQSLTLSGVEDNGAVHTTGELNVSGSGGEFTPFDFQLAIPATKLDNDAGLVIRQSAPGSISSLNVTESGTEVYTVALAARSAATSAPNTTISVRMATGGDSSFSVTPSVLTFSQSDWSTGQSVTVSAAADDDMVAGTAVVEHVSGQTASASDAYVGVSATLAVTETDTNRVGVTLTPTSLSVPENGTANYTVVLDTEPTGEVVIAIANPTDGTHDDDLTLSTTSLIFDASTWSTPKTVVVSAAADNADVGNGTALFEHKATGGGYGGVTATLSATEDDDDTISLVLSATAIEVSEGGSTGYSVRLDSKPTAAVTVTITKASATEDSDLTLSKTSLTFAAGTWNTPQMVSVTAAEDDSDIADGTAVFVHDASAGGYGNVSATLTATELDNDLARIIVRPLSVVVPEGDSTTYGVRLGSAPTADVTVSTRIFAPHWTDVASRVTVDTAAVAGTQSTLIFTATNWKTAQIVTVAVSSDDDNLNERARIVHSASDTGGYGNAPNADLVLDVADDENSLDISLSRAGLVFTEGGTAAFSVRVKSAITNDVTVNLTLPGASAPTVSPAVLTFTPTNYADSQAVTVSSTDNEGASHFMGTLTVAATGGLTQTSMVDVFVHDDDAGLLIRRSEGTDISSLTVTEGRTEVYKVALAARNDIAATTTISVAVASGGDGSFSVNPSTLTFSQSNWNTGKNVVISAASDADAFPGIASVQHVSKQTSATDAYVGASASLAVTESETGTAGVMLTPTSLTVPEGGTKTYAVVLKSEPTAPVTVSITQPSDTDDASLTVSKSTLNFTTGTWNTPQIVTVSAAADDSDVADGTASFLHSASGGDYTGLTATLSATEEDDDATLTLSATSLTVSEGGSAEYTVALDTQPTGAVTITITHPMGSTNDDDDLTLSTTSLIFDASTWRPAKTVTVTAAADNVDVADGTALFEHKATGGGYGGVTATLSATEEDDDTISLVLSATAFDVLEGGSKSYSVRLDSEPTAEVTVDIDHPMGSTNDDDDLTVSPAQLKFTAGNWNSAQTVTVTATADTDMSDGTAVFVHNASAGGYDNVSATLTATEVDDDLARLIVRPTSLVIVEGSSASYALSLGSAPTADVTVSTRLYAPSWATVGDRVTVDTVPDTTGNQATLTFTMTNWSVAQSVKVEISSDTNNVNEENAQIIHSVTGGYVGAPNLALPLAFRDTGGNLDFQLTRNIVVTEGETVTFGVRMKAAPAATEYLDMNIPILNRFDGLTVTPNVTNFSATNWSTYQTIAVSIADNDFAQHRSDTLTFSLRSGGASYIFNLVERDNDAALVIREVGSTDNLTSLQVDEGSTNTYTLALAAENKAATMTTVGLRIASGGDGGVSFSPSAFVFNQMNWGTARTITITSAEDADAYDGVSLVEHFTGQTATTDAYRGIVSTLTITQNDDETAGLTLSTTDLDVSEGGSASYTVELDSEPTATVTVTVAKSTGGSPDADLTLSSPSGGELTFTNGSNGNWNTAQTVVVAAAADNDDVAEGTAVFTHSATGGDYNNLSATLTATEADDDATLTLSATSLTVSEGGSANYTLQLATKPTADVKVTITRSSSQGTDTDLTATVTPTDGFLTFTTSNWNTAQTVAVAAAADNDEVAEGTAEFEHSATGGGYGDAVATLTATEDDDDAAIAFSVTGLTVTEGMTATYGVKLATKPTASVTLAVAPSGPSAETDVTVTGGASLTFTTENWNDNQEVELTAGEDVDSANGTEAIIHDASNGGYGDVLATLTVTEADNDPLGFVYAQSDGTALSSLSVPENGTVIYQVKLASQPSASTAVTVQALGGTNDDSDLSVVGPFLPGQLELAFLVTNWNDYQMVTLTAAPDADAAAGTARIRHRASGTDSDYNDFSANLTVTENDDDAALTLSVSTLTVTEEGSAGYTVQLAAQPGGNVTVTVANASGDTDDTDLSVTTGAFLTFTATNWNTAQPVSLSAGDDDDYDDGTAAFTHSASGGDYGGVVSTLTVTEEDNDIRPGYVFDPASVTTSLKVPEGGTATYGVKLTTLPTGTGTVVVVGVGRTSGDSNLGLQTGLNQTQLTFKTGDWDVFQTVTLTATDDVDGAAGEAVILHRGEAGNTNFDGVEYRLNVTEADNDAALTLSVSNLTVTEAGSASFDVELAAKPGGSVTVAAAHASGDSDLSVTTGASLTFTTDNWNTAKSVVLSAATDDDTAAGTAEFTLTASAGDYDNIVATLTATESDTTQRGYLFDPAAVTTSLKVPEGNTVTYGVKLASKPSGTVWLDIARLPGNAGGDSDLAAKPVQTTLTFKTGDWNAFQTVTLTAGEDADGAAGTAVILHRGDEADYDNLEYRLIATEADNDAALTLSVRNLTVTEASSASFSVQLAAQPGGNVNVAVARKTGDDQDSDLSVKSGASLDFTASNWNTAQPVMLTAAADTDSNGDTAEFTLTATGGDYGGVSATLTATESDTTSPAILFDPASVATSLTVNEESTVLYGVKLNGKPDTSSVRVTIAKAQRQDPNISISSSSVLVFTPTTWNTSQSVTLSASHDWDSTDGTAAITHTAAGGRFSGVTATLTATEDDNDPRGFNFLPTAVTTSLTVPEGSSAVYRVRPKTRPSALMRLTVSRTAGDGDIGAKSNNLSVLTFRPGTWNVYQTVTLTAAEDNDLTDGTARIRHLAGGSDYDGTSGTLSATESDNDEAALSLSVTSLSVSEQDTSTYNVKLAYKPTAAVTVAVSRVTGGDDDLSITSGASLTFTTVNGAGGWNSFQTVQLSAADDTDFVNGTAAFEHSASGGSYDGVKATLTATEAEDDPRAFVFDPATVTTSLKVTEQATTLFKYGVKLNSIPQVGPVTVSIAKASKQDPNISISGSSSLTFTAGNAAGGWNSFQTVTLVAAQDYDSVNGTAVITHTGKGDDFEGVVATLTATEIDNDPRGFDFLPTSVTTSLTVTEGGSTTYRVRPKTRPTVQMLLSVSRVGGDGDIGVKSSNLSVLTFKPGNWNVYQTATLTAVDDDDLAAGTASIRHLAAGSDYDGESATLTATEVENDTAGLAFSRSTLPVPEQGINKYGLKLAKQPSGAVEVTVERLSTGSQDADLGLYDSTSQTKTIGTRTFTFSASDWNSYQSVTLFAAEDDDSGDGTAAFDHKATGAEYDDVTATFTATEQDNDPRQILFDLSNSLLSVSEGNTASYGVKLASQPSGPTTVTVSADSNLDSDISLQGSTQVKLTFTTSGVGDWNSYQTVTVTAAQDDDAAAGEGRIIHVASTEDTSSDYHANNAGAVLLTKEIDNDAALTLSTSSLSVPEGGTATYDVQLAAKPGGSVTVAVSRLTTGSPDTDLTLTGGATLTFTTDNWDTGQPVELSAAEDEGEIANGTALFQHRATNGDYNGVTATLTATEADNDAVVQLSPSSLEIFEGGSGTYEVKLKIQPTGPVSVTIAKSTAGTPDMRPESGEQLNADFGFHGGHDWNTAEDGDGDGDGRHRHERRHGGLFA